MFYDIEKGGQRIRQLRVLNHYTQEKIACLLHIDRSFYSRIESGQKGCSVDLFVRLAAFYHVSLDYLILGEVNDSVNTSQLKAEVEVLIAHLDAFKETL